MVSAGMAFTSCNNSASHDSEQDDTLTHEQVAEITAAAQAERTAREMEAMQKQAAADSAATKAIVGHWTGIPLTPEVVEHYVFNADGTATMWAVGPKGKSGNETFTYKIQGGHVLVTSDGETSDEFSINGTTLTDKSGNAYTKEEQ